MGGSRLNLNFKGGHVLTNWNDLPKYKGETGWFGLAKYRDVIVPEDYNRSTSVYMDTPVKQYFYDVMAGYKSTAIIINECVLFEKLSLTLFPLIFALAGCSLIMVLLTVASLLVVLFLLLKPYEVKLTRRQIEATRNMSAETILDAGYMAREDLHFSNAKRVKNLQKNWHGHKHWSER